MHKKGAFLPFIEKEKPDIICLQEVKSKKEQNDFDLKDYEEYWNPAEKAGYSGTAIFVKKRENLKILNVSLGFPAQIAEKYNLKEDKYGDLNKEGRILTLEFDSPAGEFYLVNCYTPNSKQDLSRLSLRDKKWDPAFLEYISELKSRKNVIFCGDLNVAHTEDDLANPKQNEGEHGFTKEERDGLDKIIESGFVDTFREFKKGKGFYTWWSHFAKSRERNVGWRIDYFFVNKEFLNKVKTSDILPDVSGSDHCPILLELKN